MLAALDWLVEEEDGELSNHYVLAKAQCTLSAEEGCISNNGIFHASLGRDDLPADFVLPLGVDVLRRREVGVLLGDVHEQEAHIVAHLDDLMGTVLARPVRHVEDFLPLAVVLVLQVPRQLLQEESEEQLVHLAVEDHLVR